MKTITIAPLRVSPRSTSIRTLASLLGVSALCLVCNPVNASFEEGKRQFERGNYSQALEAFQAERRARPNDPAVLYNLATTQFRLGQLGEAKRVYAELAENPEWSDVAHYNLGLVALQQGDTEQAQADFRYVIDQSSSAELRSLASQRLTAARAGRTQDRDWGISGLARFGINRDNNAANLPDEQTLASSETQDSYADALLYVQGYPVGSPKSGAKAHAYYYGRQYDELASLDTHIVGTGITWEQPLGALDTRSQINAVYSERDGSRTTARYGLEWAAERDWGGVNYEGKYRLSYYDGAASFSYLEGTQQRLSASARKSLSRGWVRLTAQHEINDRDDLRGDQYFYSYSPTINSVKVDGRWVITDALVMGAALGYADYDYQGENTRVDGDGVVNRETRQSDRMTYELTADYRLSEHWKLQGKFSSTNNDENVDLYTFDKDVTSVRMIYSF